MISTPPAVQTPVSLSLPRSLKSIQEIRRTAHNPPPPPPPPPAGLLLTGCQMENWTICKILIKSFSVI